MLKIGIVGSDNSHAIRFSELANGVKDFDTEIECSVTHLFGREDERNQEVAEEGQIPNIVDDPEEMIGEIDAAMVVFRHGGLHARYALPFLEAGLPVFVDKPFAIDLEECEKMIAAAEANNAPLTSYSTLRYDQGVVELAEKANEANEELTQGYCVGPCDFTSEYGGPFFYGTHALEIIFRIFGYEVESVTARGDKEQDVMALIKYESGCIVSAGLVKKGVYTFSACALGTEKYLCSEDVRTGTNYAEGLKVFLHMARTGEKPLEYDQILKPIEVMHAIKDALENKKTVSL